MLIPGFALRLPCNDTPVCCQTFVDGRAVRLLDLFLGKFTESSIEGILITSLEEYQINRWLFALVFFQSIIDPVFSGIPFKGLDIFVRDLDIDHPSILFYDFCFRKPASYQTNFLPFNDIPYKNVYRSDHIHWNHDTSDQCSNNDT